MMQSIEARHLAQAREIWSLLPGRDVPPAATLASTCRDRQVVLLSPDDLLLDRIQGARFLSEIANSRHLLLVSHPATGVWLPYWVTDDIAGSLRRLLQDSAERPSAEVFEVLQTAGIVDRPAVHGEIDNCLGVAFAQNGVVTVRNAINAFHTERLAAYFRGLHTLGSFVPEARIPFRKYIKDDPIAMFYHFAFAGFVSDVVGTPVKPSYSFISLYENGAELKPHHDREQCVYNISLALDYGAAKEWIWPMRLERDGKIHHANLCPGDAVLFLGREMLHSRSKLVEADSSIIMLLHYVPEDFTGRLT
jgi:hypothetical protein